MVSPLRLIPGRPFPPYSYVPRRFPHPLRDADGHSYGLGGTNVELLTDDNWRESEAYLYGMDLFNHGYYWEAHEAWEGLWHACGRRGNIAEFLKALIKLAAAGVKAREGNEAGVRRAALRAAELFRAIAAAEPGESARFLGLSLPKLIADAEDLALHADLALKVSDAPVVVTLPFKLTAERVGDSPP